MALKIDRKTSIISSLFVMGCAVVTGATLSFLHDRNDTASAAQATYTVTTTADGGAGSLRQAITDANTNPTTDAAPHRIEFAIAGTGVQTISLTSALPVITQPTVVDGTTQAGSSCGTLVPNLPASSNTPHTLTVMITTRNIAAGADVLSFGPTADSPIVRGLVLNGAQSKSTYNLIVNAPNMRVECNYIGPEADGQTVVDYNAAAGLYVQAVGDNVTVQNNLISGNGLRSVIGDRTGGLLISSDAIELVVERNIVGWDKTGLCSYAEPYVGGGAKRWHCCWLWHHRHSPDSQRCGRKYGRARLQRRE